MSYLIDTHSHIDMIEDDINIVVSRALESGVEKIILPSVDVNSFDKVIELSKAYNCVYGALGFHPTEAQEVKDDDFIKLESLLKTDKIIAIGECGLDYYWDKSFVEKQKEVFVKQIKLANEYKLPLLVHDREAHKDTFDLLCEHVSKDTKVILHCYSGSLEFAKECVKKGFYIGIGGVVTFKNAKKLHDVAKEIPLDMIVLETDAPYLAPVPFRGKNNEPSYVKYVAEEIAKIRGISFDEVCDITTQNARKVFNF